jgi:hypothetical protein
MRFAAEGSSISHAVPLHDFFKWNGAIFAIPNTFQRPPGKIHVLKIPQVLQDSLAGVVTLSASSSAS